MQSTVAAAALDNQETEKTTERLKKMALVTATPQVNEGPLFAEVDMAADSSAAGPSVYKAERLFAEAASYGSQLFEFPEAFIGGYPCGSNFGLTIGNRTSKGKADFGNIMLQSYMCLVMCIIFLLKRSSLGPDFDRLAAMAGKYKVYLVMALERVIWGFGDGSTIPVFETPIGKIGAAICWENRMPLLSTEIYAKGAALAGPNYEGEAFIPADLDLGEIARAKFDVDVVGHYSRPEVLSLVVRSHPTRPVTFTSATEKRESTQK
ncbi:hypothetical protein ACH5RR_009672 [Cinchona calisaya]|uniref:cyanoalanine nitrilase n=1 Tax=Cinchona calisaya TaxID=153742 RepID=A0ABD3AHQ7_9GENT